MENLGRCIIIILLMAVQGQLSLGQQQGYGVELNVIPQQETGQVSSNSFIPPPGLMDMPTLTGLNVSCEPNGMTVLLDFSKPFNGIVFSKGFYDDPNCRYVKENSGKSSYTFFIPNNGACGTVSEKDPNNSNLMANLENILVIQNDVLYQEIWDISRKISCVWSDTIEKLIVFRPFVVDMLDVVSVPFQNNKVECWMDIQRGTFPQSTAVDGTVKIGEPLTILIYVKDDKRVFDIRVKDCYAYDGPTYDSPGTFKLQLTDENGCPKKLKLIDYWKRTLQTGTTGASIIAFNNFTAFKFPDRMHVYMTCNIEICAGRCSNRCPGESTEPVTLSEVPTVIPPTTIRPIIVPFLPVTEPPIQTVQPPSSTLQPVQPPTWPVQPQPPLLQPVQPLPPFRPSLTVYPIEPPSIRPVQPLPPIRPVKYPSTTDQDVQPPLIEPVQPPQPPIQPLRPPPPPIQPVRPPPPPIQPVQPPPPQIQPVRPIQPGQPLPIQPVQPLPIQPVQPLPIQPVQPPIQPVQPPIQPVQPPPVQPLRPSPPPIKPVRPLPPPIQPVRPPPPTIQLVQPLIQPVQPPPPQIQPVRPSPPPIQPVRPPPPPIKPVRPPPPPIQPVRPPPPPIQPVQPLIQPVQPPIQPVQPPIQLFQPPIQPVHPPPIQLVQPPIQPLRPLIQPVHPPIQPVQPPPSPIQPVRPPPPPIQPVRPPPPPIQHVRPPPPPIQKVQPPPPPIQPVRPPPPQIQPVQPPPPPIQPVQPPPPPIQPVRPPPPPIQPVRTPPPPIQPVRPPPPFQPVRHLPPPIQPVQPLPPPIQPVRPSPPSIQPVRPQPPPIQPVRPPPIQPVRPPPIQPVRPPPIQPVRPPPIQPVRPPPIQPVRPPPIQPVRPPPIQPVRPPLQPQPPLLVTRLPPPPILPLVTQFEVAPCSCPPPPPFGSRVPQVPCRCPPYPSTSTTSNPTADQSSCPCKLISTTTTTTTTTTAPLICPCLTATPQYLTPITRPFPTSTLRPTTFLTTTVRPINTTPRTFSTSTKQTSSSTTTRPLPPTANPTTTRRVTTTRVYPTSTICTCQPSYVNEYGQEITPPCYCPGITTKPRPTTRRPTTTTRPPPPTTSRITTTKVYPTSTICTCQPSYVNEYGQEIIPPCYCPGITTKPPPTTRRPTTTPRPPPPTTTRLVTTTRVYPSSTLCTCQPLYIDEYGQEITPSCNCPGVTTRPPPTTRRPTTTPRPPPPTTTIRVTTTRIYPTSTACTCQPPYIDEYGQEITPPCNCPGVTTRPPPTTRRPTTTPRPPPPTTTRRVTTTRVYPTSTVCNCQPSYIDEYGQEITPPCNCPGITTRPPPTTRRPTTTPRPPPPTTRRRVTTTRVYPSSTLCTCQPSYIDEYGQEITPPCNCPGVTTRPPPITRRPTTTPRPPPPTTTLRVTTTRIYPTSTACTCQPPYIDEYGQEITPPCNCPGVTTRPPHTTRRPTTTPRPPPPTTTRRVTTTRVYPTSTVCNCQPSYIDEYGQEITPPCNCPGVTTRLPPTTRRPTTSPRPPPPTTTRRVTTTRVYPTSTVCTCQPPYIDEYEQEITPPCNCPGVTTRPPPTTRRPTTTPRPPPPTTTRRVTTTRVYPTSTACTCQPPYFDEYGQEITPPCNCPGVTTRPPPTTRRPTTTPRPPPPTTTRRVTTTKIYPTSTVCTCQPPYIDEYGQEITPPCNCPGITTRPPSTTERPTTTPRPSPTTTRVYPTSIQTFPPIRVTTRCSCRPSYINDYGQEVTPPCNCPGVSTRPTTIKPITTTASPITDCKCPPPIVGPYGEVIEQPCHCLTPLPVTKPTTKSTVCPCKLISSTTTTTEAAVICPCLTATSEPRASTKFTVLVDVDTTTAHSTASFTQSTLYNGQDSRYHAFHQFHNQPIDLKKRKSRRKQLFGHRLKREAQNNIDNSFILNSKKQNISLESIVEVSETLDLSESSFCWTCINFITGIVMCFSFSAVIILICVCFFLKRRQAVKLDKKCLV